MNGKKEASEVSEMKESTKQDLEKAVEVGEQIYKDALDIEGYTKKINNKLYQREAILDLIDHQARLMIASSDYLKDVIARLKKDFNELDEVLK